MGKNKSAKQRKDSEDKQPEKSIKIEQAVKLCDLVEQAIQRKEGKQSKQEEKPSEIREDDDPMKYIQGREDLWINQLKKQQKPQDQEEEAEVVCVFNVPEDQIQKPKIDVDIHMNEMTKEQREVFDALMDEDGEYEELDDDFVINCMEGDKEAKQQISEVKETKKVQFKEVEDKDEDYEDQEEEEEITYDKKKLQQQYEQKIKQQEKQQQNKHQKQQKHIEEEDDDDDDSDMEINSDLEAQFEREMKNYEDEDENNHQKEENDQLGMQQLNKILDDHLLVMKKKEAQSKEFIPKQKEEDEYEKEARLDKLKKKDYLAYLKEKYPDTDPSEFHMPEQVAKIEFENDLVLQAYLNRQSTDEELSDLEEAEQNPETIISKQLHESTMSKMNPAQLNIIKYKGKEKKNEKIVEETEKEKRERIQEEKEKEKQEKIQKLKQLKINQNETAEEKKQRKQMIKDMKKQQKEKKKIFKEKVREVQKNVLNQKKANIEHQQSEGVSIQKM